MPNFLTDEIKNGYDRRAEPWNGERGMWEWRNGSGEENQLKMGESPIKAG